MKDPSSAASKLCQMLSHNIIPQVEEKDHVKMIMARRPLRLPQEIVTKRLPAPCLRINGKQRSGWFLAQHKQEAMHALRVPYFCFVVEGEIDIRLGIPARHGKTRGVVNTYDILTLPANTFLHIPPGVFFPESGAHWERETLPVADSRLFWLHILPTGALCHTCTTRNGMHTFENYDVFVPDTQLTTLADILSDEIQSIDPYSCHTASNALLLLLLRVRNSLHHSEIAPKAGRWDSYDKRRLSKMARPEMATLSTNSEIVEKACKYIQKNLSHNIDQVASQVYVSSSHLSKLFRIHLKTTIRKYVLDQRMEVARSFLMNTEISIKEIARFAGYMQPPQFSRVFKQVHHITPQEFRQKHYRKEK